MVDAFQRAARGSVIVMEILVPVLETYAGAGVFPLLSNQDVQSVALLQVEDAQHRHAMGPHHGVLPAFPTSSSVA